MTDQIDLPPAEDGSPVMVRLTDELDWQVGWMPSREAPKPKVEIHRGGAAASPLLPSWQELAAIQAGEITSQLHGSGVLVTPQVWRESRVGRTFLRAWAEAGWTWAPLEEILQLKFTAGVRFVSAGQSWLRISEPTGSAVTANGAEAAVAIELVEPILDRALDAAGSEVAAEWLQSEQPHSGWFTRQQIVRLGTEALREGPGSLELGTSEAPLFLFASKEAQERYRALADLRVTVDLPRPSAAIWWEQIAEPEFLVPPQGVSRRPAIGWRDMETILVEHQKGAAERPTHRLDQYLKFNGRSRRPIGPTELVEAVQVASDLGKWLARWDEKDREAERPSVVAETADSPPVAAAEPPPLEAPRGEEPVEPGIVEEEQAADPLAAFRPEKLTIGEPHRAEYLRVWVDGESIDPENVHPTEAEGGQRGYSIEGTAVARGAVVRIDFEPGA